MEVREDDFVCFKVFVFCSENLVGGMINEKYMWKYRMVKRSNNKNNNNENNKKNSHSNYQ